MAHYRLACLSTGSPEYPERLRLHLGADAPATVYALGNLDILRRRVLALFCSVRCPGDLILQTYDLARALRDAGVTVIGGFHSPMERECLTLLLRGSQPLIICPARSLAGMRLPAAWRPPLAAGRLLVLSPFGGRQRRVTADLARERNRFVAALADEVFVAHAAPGSGTERLCRAVLAWGTPLRTLESPENAEIIAAGAAATRVSLLGP